MSDNGNGEPGSSNNKRKSPRRSSRLNRGVPAPFLQQNYVLNGNKPAQTPASVSGSSSDGAQDCIVVGPLPTAGRAETAIAAIRQAPSAEKPVRRPPARSQQNLRNRLPRLPQTPSQAEVSRQVKASRAQTARRARGSRASTRGQGHPRGRPTPQPRPSRQVQPARHAAQTQQLHADSQAQGGNSRPSRPANTMSAKDFIISRMAEELRKDPDKEMRDDLAEHRSKIEAILVGDGIVQSFMQDDDGLGPDTSQHFDEPFDLNQLLHPDLADPIAQEDNGLGPDTSQPFDGSNYPYQPIDPNLYNPIAYEDSYGLGPATPQFFGDFIARPNNNGLGLGTAQNFDGFGGHFQPLHPNHANPNAGEDNHGLATDESNGLHQLLHLDVFHPPEDEESRGAE